MLYNSFLFLMFFPIAVLLYYAVPQKWKWVYIVVVSYWFYANWNPPSLLLMMWITGITYWGGRLLSRNSTTLPQDKINHLLFKTIGKGRLLAIVMALTIAPLLAFKYLNFFTQSVWGVLSACGLRLEIPIVDWMLPIGISFYTFQAIGYLIDVYKEKIKAERHLGYYAAFISFFPQTAAGPIGRAGSLLPQMRCPHGLKIENVSQGLKWMLWGYFMKVAVADRLALYTDAVMGNVAHHNGSSVLLAAVLFSIQIYCDFGGYSLLAVGAGKVMGYDLIMNFQRPYMSQSVGEFWRRWHISLSTWFRDYIYFPLGGSRCSKWRTNMNLMITFLVSGLWHGAAWTFVFWGGLNGLFQIIERPFLANAKVLKISDKFIKVKVMGKIAMTFILMTIAWVFFKANTFADAWEALTKMCVPVGKLYVPQMSTIIYCLAGALIVMTEDIWHERIGRHPLLEAKHTWVRMVSIVVITMYILSFGVFDGGQFIYFKF